MSTNCRSPFESVASLSTKHRYTDRIQHELRLCKTRRMVPPKFEVGTVRLSPTFMQTIMVEHANVVRAVMIFYRNPLSLTS